MRTIFVLLPVALLAVSFSTAGLTHPVPMRTTVGCDQSVGTAERPYAEAGVVLDRIGLPRGRYPWKVERSNDPVFKFWAKWGALTRAGTGRL